MPDARNRIASRLLGAALVATLALGASAPARAQETGTGDPQACFQAAVRSLAKNQGFTGPTEVRELARAVDALQSLAHAPPALRKRGAAWLRKLLDRRPPLQLPVRVAATRSLVALAAEAHWIPVFLAIAQRADAQKDVDFLYHLGFTLRQLRSPAAVERLGTHLHDSRDFAVALAAEALAHLTRPQLLAPIAMHRARVRDLARSAPAPIRAACVKLLGRLRDPASVGVLLAASKDASSSVRRSAAQAIGELLELPGALAALGRLLEDSDPRVREAAAIALRGTRKASVMPLLVARLPKEPLRIRAEIAETLHVLGAPDLGPDPAVWKAWLPGARRGEGETLAADKRSLQTRPGAKRRYELSYYDIPVLTDRAVFVVDTSGSMDYREASTGKTRFDRARAELERVLRKLPKSTRFGVVTFGWTARTLPTDGLIRADRASVARALSFVAGHKPSGGTNTHAALKLAFDRYAEADTLYFLSDGSPTVGAEIRPEALTAQVARWNRQRGIRIHTIALVSGEPQTRDAIQTVDPEDAVRFMRQLALHNDGATRRVP